MSKAQRDAFFEGAVYGQEHPYTNFAYIEAEALRRCPDAPPSAPAEGSAEQGEPVDLFEAMLRLSEEYSKDANNKKIDASDRAWSMSVSNRITEVLDEHPRPVPAPNGELREAAVSLTERRAEFVYEAARIAAIAAGAPIVPVPWGQREENFRSQFLMVIEKQCGPSRSHSPSELHGTWMDAYFKNGWKYGEKYDREKRIHPDLIPYDQLGQLERDKDAVFVALCEIARQWIYEAAPPPAPADCLCSEWVGKANTACPVHGEAREGGNG
jgi:hypothetical protein